MIRGIVEVFRKMPPAVRLILGMVVAALILNPVSRAKIGEWAKILWERLRENKAVLVSLSQEAVKHLAEAAQTSRATGHEITSRMRFRGHKLPYPIFGLICLRSKEPLSADEIARRILANGYLHAPDFHRLRPALALKQDGRFVANAEGLWMLRSTA